MKRSKVGVAVVSCVMGRLLLVVRPFCREGRAGSVSSCYDMGAETEHGNMLKRKTMLYTLWTNSVGRKSTLRRSPTPPSKPYRTHLDKSTLLPLVYLLMPLHIVQPRKSPTTLGALMRPLPSMAQLVIALVEFARERLVAQRARMNGLLSLFQYRCAEFVGQVARLWVEGAGMPRRCKCACWEG
jgi:hypothetical protein